MDSERFDDLSRKLATPRSRREVLGVLGAAVAGLFAGGAASAAPRADKPSKCYGGGSHCTNARQCCSGICTNRQCEPEGAAGCASAAECPDVDSDCQQRTCVDGACGIANTPYGTPLANQVAGDCRQAVCDGAGGVTTTVDASDVPVAPCWLGACEDGQPVLYEAPAAVECNVDGGKVCDGYGQCVQCLSDPDCDDGQVCQDGACVAIGECVEDAECGACGVCAGGACEPVPASAQVLCRAAAGPCDVAEYCDGLSLECPADQFAPSATMCRSPANDCDVAEYCTGNSPYCPPDLRQANGTPCSVGTCQMGICTDTACDPGYEWNGTTCVDIDECGRSLDNCSEFAICTNTDGGFTCECEVGFTGDGVICTLDTSQV